MSCRTGRGRFVSITFAFVDLVQNAFVVLFVWSMCPVTCVEHQSMASFQLHLFFNCDWCGCTVCVFVLVVAAASAVVSSYFLLQVVAVLLSMFHFTRFYCRN